MAGSLSPQTLVKYSILALLLPWALEYARGRWHAVSCMVNNQPDKLSSVAAFREHETQFAGRVRNCEDAIMIEESQVAVLTCDAGRDGWNTVMGAFAKERDLVPNGELFLYRYYSESKAAGQDTLDTIPLVGYPEGKEAGDFHPLGIEYHAPSKTLFVVNHHRQGPRLELFRLDLTEPRPVAQHLRTVIHPLIHTPNAVVPISENELYITNDHYLKIKDYPWLAFFETYLAPPLAGVVYIKLGAGAGVEAKTVARLPFANGAALLNRTTLAVTSTSNPGIYLYEVPASGGPKGLRLKRVVRVPFMPDNLSVDSRGALLVAGHPHAPTLTKLKRARVACLDEVHSSGRGDGEECGGKARAPSWVSEWTEESGLRHLYVSGDGFGSSTTAVRDPDAGVGIVAGLYENGIFVWRE